ncbi:MAG TPA: hypothetical protein VH482_17180 [Thermomicrobiales bacterium]|jgi:hypothetical protein
MNLATELRQLVAASGAPVEFAQGSYRLRVMPGAGRVRDVSFSIWEAQDRRWEPILTGWARGEGLIAATWRAPGSPANAESLIRVILAGKRLPAETPVGRSAGESVTFYR